MMILALGTYRCSGGKKVAESSHEEIIRTNIDGKGTTITVNFKKGEAHNHPLMAIWLEDTAGKYIETLYVAESIGKGVFRRGEKSGGQWVAGPIRRPAALPYWGHKRGVVAPDGYYLPTPEDPVPDAVTGPTPKGDFTLVGKSTTALPAEFRILLEINQSWDWNEYWTNNKYPDDVNYKTSSQPALVYEAVVPAGTAQKELAMSPIGHSHYSGLDGSLDKDLSTITTALSIVESIKVVIE